VFCADHIRYLLLLRDQLLSAGVSEDMVGAELLREERALAYPVPGTFRPVVLPGGKS
jgi:hypothetical protein